MRNIYDSYIMNLFLAMVLKIYLISTKTAPKSVQKCHPGTDIIIMQSFTNICFYDNKISSYLSLRHRLSLQIQMDTSTEIH